MSYDSVPCVKCKKPTDGISFGHCYLCWSALPRPERRRIAREASKVAEAGINAALRKLRKESP